jgi:hypothetical protein
LPTLPKLPTLPTFGGQLRQREDSRRIANRRKCPEHFQCWQC